MGRLSGIRDHRPSLGRCRPGARHRDIPQVQGTWSLPGDENQTIYHQGSPTRPAWDALQKIDALNRNRKAETVDIVERDNKTVRKHKLHLVFLNTKSGLPHANDFVVRDRFFKAHLLAAGVRYRGPGQCRHTYASQLLTTGVASIDWIAEQIEHTNGNMIRQHYGTWINEDGPDVVGMLQLALRL